VITPTLPSAASWGGRSDRLEVGLGLQGNKAPEAYAKIARLAEEYGFDVLTVFSDLMY